MSKHTKGPVKAELLRWGRDGVQGFAITSPGKNQPLCGIGVATPNIVTTLGEPWKDCHPDRDQFFTAEELESNAALIASPPSSPRSTPAGRACARGCTRWR